ncbi:MAG: metal-dependent hydrolase [Candidatus Micrarchaeota archaeon]
MKTGFSEHLTLGFVVCLALVLISVVYSPQPIHILAAACALFILGSVLPDIDSPVSVVRKFAKRILFIVLVILCLASAFLFQTQLLSVCTNYISANECTFASLLLAFLFPLLAVSILDILIPFHRGPLHSLLAAPIYGLLCYAALNFAALSAGDALFIALFAGSGYMLHILFDMIGGFL